MRHQPARKVPADEQPRAHNVHDEEHGSHQTPLRRHKERCTARLWVPSACNAHRCHPSVSMGAHHIPRMKHLGGHRCACLQLAPHVGPAPLLAGRPSAGRTPHMRSALLATHMRTPGLSFEPPKATAARVQLGRTHAGLPFASPKETTSAADKQRCPAHHRKATRPHNNPGRPASPPQGNTPAQQARPPCASPNGAAQAGRSGITPCNEQKAPKKSTHDAPAPRHAAHTPFLLPALPEHRARLQLHREHTHPAHPVTTKNLHIRPAGAIRGTINTSTCPAHTREQQLRASHSPKMPGGGTAAPWGRGNLGHDSRSVHPAIRRAARRTAQERIERIQQCMQACERRPRSRGAHARQGPEPGTKNPCFRRPRMAGGPVNTKIMEEKKKHIVLEPGRDRAAAEQAVALRRETRERREPRPRTASAHMLSLIHI